GGAGSNPSTQIPLPHFFNRIICFWARVWLNSGRADSVSCRPRTRRAFGQAGECPNREQDIKIVPESPTTRKLARPVNASAFVGTNAADEAITVAVGTTIADRANGR